MGKTSSVVKDRWNKKAYDQIGLRIPKGRKDTLEQHAKERGESVNGYINRLIQIDLGLTMEQWKNCKEETPDI